MSHVRSSGNLTTEIAFAKLLRVHGLVGWRRNNSNLSGRPDFIFPKKRIAVFLDGCFWHGCPSCRRFPETRADYWKCRFQKNRLRDSKVNRNLRASGWKVIRIWEHEISNNVINRKLKIIQASLKSI
jgi:DNA mismatch endonuclease (patch repair protein)